MDEIVLRGLTRQLKILNIWITIFGSLILVALIICIILVVRVFMFVNETQDRITNLQEKAESSLNVKQQLCDTNSVGSLLEKRSEICK